MPAREEGGVWEDQFHIQPHRGVGGGREDRDPFLLCSYTKTEGEGRLRGRGAHHGKGGGVGPVSSWDPVEHRPDRAAGRTGHCPDPGLATP